MKGLKGRGRGLGGEMQGAKLFEQLQTALAEKETHEVEGGSGEGNFNNTSSFEECIANIGLWLQVNINHYFGHASIGLCSISSPISVPIELATYWDCKMGIITL